MTSTILDNITYTHNPEGSGSQLVVNTLHSCYSHALIDHIFPYYWVLEDLCAHKYCMSAPQIVVRKDAFIEFPHNYENIENGTYKGIYIELINLITDKPVLFDTDHIFEHTYAYPIDDMCTRSIWNSSLHYPDRSALPVEPFYPDSVVKEKLDSFYNHVLNRLNISTNVKRGATIIERRDSRKLHRSIVQKLLYYLECSVVYLEDLSFSAQVELFNSSSVIILAHGSAEINLLFAPKNALVFEFDTETDRESIYKRLCNLRELTHTVLPHSEDLDVKTEIVDKITGLKDVKY